MSTIVSFHAHPDDEAILCGGTLAKAASEGHRVVVVTATQSSVVDAVEQENLLARSDLLPYPRASTS